MSKKVIKTISNQPGTVTKDGAAPVKVRFSLTQWQEFIDDEIPSLTSAIGTIEFEDTAKAFYFFTAGYTVVLNGGGITASIVFTSPTAFKVGGQIKDAPETLLLELSECEGSANQAQAVVDALLLLQPIVRPNHDPSHT